MSAPSGYLPSQNSQDRLIQTILAIASLQEKQESGRALRAYRESARLKMEQDAQKAADEAQEKDIRVGSEALFGQKYDAEMEPALKPFRQAIASGTPPSATKPTPGWRAGEVTVPVQGSTAPGLGVPNLVSRPPQMSDVSTISGQGAQAVRNDALAKFTAITGKGEGDPLYDYFKTSGKIPLPGQITGEVKETAEARKSRTAAEIAEETKPAEVARVKAVSREQEAKAAKSELDLAKERAAEPYYRQNALNESIIKQNEALEKEFLVSQQPERAAEQRAKNIKLRQEIDLNNQTIDKHNQILHYSDIYNKSTDPNVREEAARRIAVLNGQTPQLMSHDLQAQKAGIDANNEALRARATGKQLFANKQFEEGTAAYTIANNHAVQAAKINKSPTVELIIPQRTGGYFWGEYQPEIGRVVTNTARAEMYVNGELDAIAKGTLRKPTGNMVRLEPGMDVQPEFYDPADALAWKIYYDNLPISTNAAELTKRLSQYDAPQDVKERALRKIQVITRESPVTLENVPQNTQRGGLRPLTEEERKVPRNWAGVESQPTRGFQAAPSGGPSQLPEGTKVELPEAARFKPASKEQNRAQFTPIIDAAADKYNIDKGIFHKLVDTESQYDRYAKSPKGAIGLTQLMPDTAKQLGVDPTNPRQNVEGGARYLRQLLDRYNGDMRKALIAYNWGMGNYENSLKSGAPLPKETQDFVTSILGVSRG